MGGPKSYDSIRQKLWYSTYYTLLTIFVSCVTYPQSTLYWRKVERVSRVSWGRWSTLVRLARPLWPAPTERLWRGVAGEGAGRQ